MERSTAIELAMEILRTYEQEGDHPMPNSDLARILDQVEETEEEFEFINARLSGYWLDIGGLCTRAKELRLEPIESLLRMQEHLTKSFFDWYPSFKPFAPLMTAANTPRLYAELALHEKLRMQLLELIALLLAERSRSTGVR